MRTSWRSQAHWTDRSLNCDLSPLVLRPFLHVWPVSLSFTDTPYDPYDSTRGLWYSHCGWLFEAPPFNPKTKLIDMRDVDKDEGRFSRVD